MTYTDYNINVKQNEYEGFWSVSCKKDFLQLKYILSRNIKLGKLPYIFQLATILKRLNWSI